MSNIGFLLDIDGLLLNSEGFQYEATRRALASQGAEFTPGAYKNFAGQGHLEIAKQLVKLYDIDIKPEELVGEKFKHLDHMLKTESIEFMPYARETIDIARKFPLALVTNGNRKETVIKTERSGLSEMIDGAPVATRSDVESGKPAPDLYLLGSELIDVPAEHCIAMDDSEPGVMSANLAGAIATAVIDPRFSNLTTMPGATHNYRGLEEAMHELSSIYGF